MYSNDVGQLLEAPAGQVRPAFGGWSMLGHPLAVECLAKAGLDYVGLDVQHGFFGFDATVRAIQYLDALGVSALVRIPFADLAQLPRYLDAGATGAIIAMVDGADDAECAVRRSRYQPEGERSYGGQRHGLRPEPADVAEVRPLIHVMVETVSALADVEGIAAVPGVTGLYVGPVDLSLAAGCRPDMRDRDFAAALRRVCDAAHSHGIRAGTFAVSGADARSLAGVGFDEVVVASDVALLRKALAVEVAATRDTPADTAGS